MSVLSGLFVTMLGLFFFGTVLMLEKSLVKGFRLEKDGLGAHQQNRVYRLYRSRKAVSLITCRMPPFLATIIAPTGLFLFASEMTDDPVLRLTYYLSPALIFYFLVLNQKDWILNMDEMLAREYSNFMHSRAGEECNFVLMHAAPGIANAKQTLETRMKFLQTLESGRLRLFPDEVKEIVRILAEESGELGQAAASLLNCS